MSMSQKFLRPPPQHYDSEEDEDDDEEEEEEEEDELSESGDDRHNNKRKRGSNSQTNRKRSKASSFFELEAEDEDDEDEEEAHHAGEDMDEEAKEIMRQQDLRRAQAGARFQERSVAEISRAIEERHRMQRRTVDRSALLERPRVTAGKMSAPSAKKVAATSSAPPSARPIADVNDDEEGGPEVYTAVAQQSLVPSVSDPSLWMVSCSNGKEQELVFQIMNKCTAFARQGKPLGITAAIAAQSKGKIYIESFSEPAVMEAIQGVRGLLPYSMRLVPIQDMTTVMTVVAKKKPVRANEWVRMTRGHYKGDLALVKMVKESGLKCVIQCIPRLDLTLGDLPAEEARARRRAVRPPQKFFNPQEIAALGKQTLRRQRFPGLDLFCDYFEGNYYHDGYLLKEMNVGSMIKPCSEEDPPSLEELQNFQRKPKPDEAGGATENEGSKLASSLLDELSELQGKTGLGKKADGGLIIGDTVEIIEGDLVGMRGKVVSLDGTTVKVAPTQANLGGTSEVEFLASQVRKYIAVGAHVKVTDGRYANETGVVVAVEQLDGETDFTAVVLTDITNKEISVRTSQLRESAEIATGLDKLQGYELYDLVVLAGGGSANEVGVIVRVGREDFTVINNHGIEREVRPEELRGKRNSTSTRAVALDVQGNQIRVGDSVNVTEGPHKGKTATIKRMSRAQLFLHSQTRSEHAGIFVVRSRSCVLAGSKSQNRGGGMDGGVSPFATPQSQARGGPGGARAKRDDSLMGKTVRVQAGQWKGYIGTVTDTTATHVQVELHSRLKKVLVLRERVAVVGDKFGATEMQMDADANMPAPMTATMATPMHSIGGATPAIHGFGGATPAHDPENSDEVWRPGGAIDQEAIKDDGWGADSSMKQDEEGWGTSSGSVWNPSAASHKKEETMSEDKFIPQRESQTMPPPAIKREQPSEMDTEIIDTQEIPPWYMDRVYVQIKSSGEKGFIKDINADKSAVLEMEDKSTKTVRVGEISMVSPVEHDTVLVTGGNEIGLEGSLVCVDGSDAILKDANDEFKIIDYIHLAKITAEN